MNYLANAATFLIQTAFGFFIGLFLVRMLLIAAGASFYDPICRFVYQLTNPVITPLRRYIPRWRRVEIASLLVALVLILIEYGLFIAISGAAVGFAGLFLRALVALLDWLIWIELIALFARGILSFVVSEYSNSNMQLLVQCTEPVVRPFRRILPPFAGFDFSLTLAMIALILAQMLVIAPLNDLAAHA
jgi:YggT family protein